MDKLTQKAGPGISAVPIKFDMDFVFHMAHKDYEGLIEVLEKLHEFERMMEQYNIPDLATLETLLKANAEGCIWEQEDRDGSTWHCNQCGATWTFTDDGPGENGMKYCMECGRRAVGVQPWVDEDDEQNMEAKCND